MSLAGTLDRRFEGAGLTRQVNRQGRRIDHTERRTPGRRGNDGADRPKLKHAQRRHYRGIDVIDRWQDAVRQRSLHLDVNAGGRAFLADTATGMQINPSSFDLSPSQVRKDAPGGNLSV